MSYTRFRKRLEVLLAVAGIRIDGDRPWDIEVHNEAQDRKLDLIDCRLRLESGMTSVSFACGVTF